MLNYYTPRFFICQLFEQEFFKNKDTEEEQDYFRYMYEDESSFYKFIEYLY